MTKEISAQCLAVYEALGASPSGRIAVKLSAGELGSNYLRTDLNSFIHCKVIDIVPFIISGKNTKEDNAQGFSGNLERGTSLR